VRDYASVTPRLTSSQPLEPGLGLCRPVDDHRPWVRETQPRHAHHVMDDPPRGRVLPRLARVLGPGGPVVLARVAQTRRQRGRPQPTPRPAQAERQARRRLVERAGGRQQAWGVAAAQAACRRPLAVVACAEGLGWPVGGAACVGGQDAPPVPLTARLPSGSRRGQRPCARGDHGVGWRAWARSPALAITGREADGALGQARGRHTVRHGHPRRPRRGCTSHGRAAPWRARVDRLVAGRAEVLVDGAWGLRRAGLRVEAHPAGLAP
jgi:hypothetical protein